MPKRNCKFTDDLQKEYHFLKKICGHIDRVKCEHCSAEFSVSHGGRCDIKDNLKSAKHKVSLAAASGSSTISTFFLSYNPAEKDLMVAAKEATFAFHTAAHNLSFKSSDCTSKLIGKFFESKFSLARTKCEAIILNVIAPLAVDELCADLNRSNFVTLSMDSSNRKEIKLIPFVVRYFSPRDGIKVKLLDFVSVPGETSKILANSLMSVITKYELTNKVIGFCGDNCNTNFGGVNRQGSNNVYSRLKKELKRDIVGIGCGAHIVHNCIQTGVDILPIDIEALLVKIYKYFHIYTVRVSQLKEFCEFADTEYKKILQHGNTRFLSMLPALERVLQMFSGLKSYFLSQEHCPILIKSLFENDSGEIYLWFVHGQLNLFNKTVLSMEKSKATATDVASELRKLKDNLIERRNNMFIPQGAKSIMQSLEKNNGVNTDKITKSFTDFYETCLSYIEKWKNSFGGADSFEWVNNTDILWKEVEQSAENINEKLVQNVINVDELFDEVVIAKSFALSNVDIWTDINLNIEEKWVKLLQINKDKNISFPNLTRVLEYIFCLPGTSAPVERVFSIMKSVWSDDRNRLAESTVKGLLYCKLNMEISCSDFYEKIKMNTAFLKKVHSSVKYE